MAKAQQLTARDLSTQRPVTLRWQQGTITSLEPADESSTLDWIAPPLVDLQVNGFAGVDFQQDNLTESDLLQATRGLHRSGCGRYLLTLITDDWTRLLDRLHHIRQLRERNPALARSIAGWHIEGPFLSPVPGFHGAHDPDRMSDPSPKRVQELKSIVAADPLLLTLAPERPGSIPTIAAAVSSGFKVSLGHTNASAEVLQQAIAAGATGFTHLGNGCPSLLDRADNLLWRVLDQSELTIGLIADGIHVSPPLFRLIHRVQASHAVYYTTDAMAAAGASPGIYTLGQLQLDVGEDRVVRQPGKSNFAGSALTPIEGVIRAAQMLGVHWRETWGGFARRPATWMGLPSDVEPGSRADFCLVKPEAEGHTPDVQLILGGEVVR